MKKNSAARNERRLVKKKFVKENKNMVKHNKCWDELEMLHAATIGLFFSTKNITPILRDERLMSKMDSKEVARIAQVISKDLAYYKERLDAIHEKHNGKTGGSEDPDVLLKSIMIGQEYYDLTESFNSIVLPNIDIVLNMAKAAAVEIENEEANKKVEEVTEPVTTETVEVNKDV